MFKQRHENLSRLLLVVGLGVFCCLSLTAADVYAQEGQRVRLLASDGTIEFGLSGKWEADSGDETVSYLDLRLGYFVYRGHEVGVDGIMGTNEYGQKDIKGVFYEYNLMIESLFLPIAGSGVYHAATPRGESADKSIRLYSSWAGLKFAVSSDVALSLIYIYQTANADVFGPSGSRSTKNKEVRLGFRLFYN